MDPTPAEQLTGATTTVEAAGEVLGISRGTAYKAAHTGDIPTIKIGRRLLVPTAWLLNELNPQ